MAIINKVLMDSFILNNVSFHNKSGEFHIYVKNGNIEKISKNSFVYPNINKFECNGLFIFQEYLMSLAKLVILVKLFSFFSNQMESASAGGFTDILCHPNTESFIDEPFVVHTLIANAKQFNGPQVYPVGALTKKLKSEKISEMSLLSTAGCICLGMQICLSVIMMFYLMH